MTTLTMLPAVETPSLVIPETFGQVDGFVEGDSGGDVRFVGEFIEAETENAFLDGVDAVEAPVLRSSLQALVQCRLLGLDSAHEFRRVGHHLFGSFGRRRSQQVFEGLFPTSPLFKGKENLDRESSGLGS